MKIVVFFFVASILVLFLRCFSYYSTQSDYKNGQIISLQVVLYEEPDISNRGQSFAVKNEQNQRIYISSNLNTLYHYGDRLAISGILQVRENEEGAVFYRLNYPSISALPQSQNPFFVASLWVREKSLKLFQEVLPKTSASLMLGIVFGAKEDFPDDFHEQLKITGVLHVIAASGMNVSFFTGAVLFSLGTVFPRRFSLLLSIFAVVFYSFLVGFEPSILRASIMAMIAITASFFGRQNLALFALYVTGFLMLLWQPNYLFDVGFQLSFMATLGILLLKPLLDSIGHKSVFFLVREDLFTTLSAQATTLPILLSTFGSVGILSVLVNVLVLWTVPILMLLGSLAILCGLLFPLIGKSLLVLALPFLFFFEQIVAFFGSANLIMQIETFPWSLFVGYYLLLGSMWLAFKHKAKQVVYTQKGYEKDTFSH